MRALHQIVATSYCVSFLLRCGWSQSFHLTTLSKLVEPFLQVVPPDCQRGTSHFQERTPLHFVWSSFPGFWAIYYERNLMKIPRYTTCRSLLKVSLSRGARPALVVHSLVGISPCFHASRSSLCFLWLTINFSRALTSLICSHRRR